MNYIYDILLNWNKELFDFYEWDLNDEIEHVRKIPIFKVSSDVLVLFVNNKISIDSEFLSKIYNKTEIFTSRNVKFLDYAALFSDGEEIVGIRFSSDGESCYKSKLLIDEASEVLDIVIRMKESKIYFENKGLEKKTFFTRKEKKIYSYLESELNRLKKDSASDKLRYLYYECFDKKSDNKFVMLNSLRKGLKDDWNSLSLKMYEFFKLTSSR